jgi:hypothetical protein
MEYGTRTLEKDPNHEDDEKISNTYEMFLTKVAIFN